MPERPFRHLCPEADARDAMDDGEFWEHVARNLGRSSDPDDEPAPGLDVALDIEPCPVCGEAGACGWDSEGRALIHTTAFGREAGDDA